MICLKDFILFLTNSSFALIFTTRNKWRSLQIDTTVFGDFYTNLIYFIPVHAQSDKWMRRITGSIPHTCPQTQRRLLWPDQGASSQCLPCQTWWLPRIHQSLRTCFRASYGTHQSPLDRSCPHPRTPYI